MSGMFLRKIGFSDELIERMLNSYIAKTYSDEQLCELWGITDDEWEYIDSRITSVTENPDNS